MERAKVIKGLQIERECVSRDCDRDCGKCDLVQDRDWLLSVYDGAIALLKEQEPVAVHDPGAYCPKCGWMLYPNDHPHHCGNCGQAVKWE